MLRFPVVNLGQQFPPPVTGGVAPPPSSFMSYEQYQRTEPARKAYCEVAKRYAGDPERLARELDVVWEAMHNIREGLDPGDRDLTMRYAEKRCPELSDLIVQMSRMESARWKEGQRKKKEEEVAKRPWVPSVDPFHPTDPSMLPFKPLAPDIPTGQPVRPAATPISTPTSVPTVDLRTSYTGPAASAVQARQPDAGRYSWTPTASAQYGQVPSCPTDQFWDGSQCRGAVRPGGLPGGLLTDGGAGQFGTAQLAPTGMPSGTLFAGAAWLGGMRPLQIRRDAGFGKAW